MDALAMTEPDAGSDVRGMKCTAKRDGGDWVVNGTKHFISGAEHADFVIVFIATGEDQTPEGAEKADHGLSGRPGPSPALRSAGWDYRPSRSAIVVTRT
jgi:Acyl-CoA dehydrogenases